MAEERLIVGSKTKDYIKSKGMMCSKDVLEAVNEYVYECLDKAAKRAEANGRKTVQARDV
ncbi:MAG: hypothetical protein ACLFWL_01420 [Candidatus Brocadiia bacterium]